MSKQPPTPLCGDCGAVFSDDHKCQQEYRVSWEIDIVATSGEEAARKALAIHRKPDSIATVFRVVDESGKGYNVDLTEIDENDS